MAIPVLALWALTVGTTVGCDYAKPTDVERLEEEIASLEAKVDSLSGLLLQLRGEIEAATSYGSAEEVRAYREQINQVIDEVNAVEQEVQETAVGSTGRATGENLAAAYERVLPRLQAVLETLDQIRPPPRLARLHRDIRRLVLLRLEAYNTVIEGWNVEQARSFAAAEPIYEQAEVKLKEANILIAQINEEIGKMEAALAETEG